MTETMTKLCGGCCCVTMIVTIILISISFSSLEVNEYGLDYSYISETVDKDPRVGGIHFLGVGHRFIKYPSTFQTIEFTNEHKRGANPAIKSRTQDGLEVLIEISFQYRLNLTQLFDLYTSFSDTYQDVFVKYAVESLTDMTTKYNAYQFFMDRTVIGQQMQKELNQIFRSQLFSQVEFFQLRSVDLPDKFENSIQQSEVKKQDIQKAAAEKAKVEVELKTKLMSAEYQKNVTINIAQGEAQAIINQAQASAESYKSVQNNMTASFKTLKKDVNMQNPELLDYIKAKVVREVEGGNLMVGLEQIDKA